jgi:glutamine cyclotransferase
MESMKIKLSFYVWCTVMMLLAACGPSDNDLPYAAPVIKPASTTKTISYTVVKQHLHDPSAFIEGFLFYGDKLLESTGSPDNMRQTRSVIGELDLEKGKLNIKAEIDRKLFGEGISVVNNNLYQLTYTSQIGFIYDAATYKKTGQFHISNAEGWGMTTDGTNLIMSDGTYNLTWINPSDFKVTKVLAVTKDGYALDRINELEYINGFIYANVYLTNSIVKIDPATGVVLAQMDLSALADDARKKNPQILEMNGIAWHPGKDQVLITGKMWPYVYEISFPH